MRFFLRVLFFVTLITSKAFAFDTPFVAGGTSLPSLTVTNYGYVFGNLLSWGTTDAAIRNVVSTAGTIKTFYVELGTAPSVGKSFVFTLVKNGTDTAVTCTISDSATSCNDLINTFTLAAGDTLSIKSAPSGTPTSPATIRFGFAFQGTTEGQSLVIGSSRGTTLSPSATNYLALQGCVGTSATLANNEQLMPTAGTFSHLYVELDGAPTAGKSYALTVMKNGVDTALSCTVSGTGTTCNDTANTFTVAATDTVVLKSVPTSTPTARIARWSLRWTPDIDGEAVMLHSNLAAALNTAGNIRYMPISGTSNSWSSGETNMQVITSGFTMRKFYVWLSTAPGGTIPSYTFRNRVNAADGAFSVAVTGAATTGNDTATSSAITAGQKICISAVSANTPAASTARYSFVAYNAPVASGVKRRVQYVKFPLLPIIFESLQPVG